MIGIWIALSEFVPRVGGSRPMAMTKIWNLLCIYQALPTTGTEYMNDHAT
jgi:hypothetical protein